MSLVRKGYLYNIIFNSLNTVFFSNNITFCSVIYIKTNIHQYFVKFSHTSCLFVYINNIFTLNPAGRVFIDVGEPGLLSTVDFKLANRNREYFFLDRYFLLSLVFVIVCVLYIDLKIKYYAVGF